MKPEDYNELFQDISFEELTELLEDEQKASNKLTTLIKVVALTILLILI